MITGRFQFFAIAAVILFFVLLFWLLKKKRLSLRYTLLWMLSGVIMLILAVFPRLLDSFARMIGIYSSVNALFAVILFCGLMLMISFTVIVSREKQEIVRAVQKIAVLEKRLQDLEEKAAKAQTGGEAGMSGETAGIKPTDWRAESERTGSSGTETGTSGVGTESAPKKPKKITREEIERVLGEGRMKS